MRRVVVTGMGIWSCIGQDLQTVIESLKTGRSGIVFDPKRIEYGLQSGLVGNVPRPDLKPLLPRKFRATMSEDAEYAYMAARQAFEQAGINDEYLQQNEVGCIWGSDGNPFFAEVGKIMDEKHDSFCVRPQSQFIGETSSISMNLSTIFHLKGIGLSVGAACASASHAIGIGKMLIQNTTQNIIIVGGASGLSNTSQTISDMVGFGFPTSIDQFSPFSKEGLGLIESGGGAALVLEEYEHAISRGVPIFAEIIGYGAYSSSDKITYHPIASSGVQAMKNALKDADISVDEIDYINPSATGAMIDDTECIDALKQLLQGGNQMISSTEAITGHENWMLGASKVVYNILMMQNGFIAPNIRLRERNENANNLNIVVECTNISIDVSATFCAGMGGSSSAIILRKV